jgi:hypothetical protein
MEEQPDRAPHLAEPDHDPDYEVEASLSTTAAQP